MSTEPSRTREKTAIQSIFAAFFGLAMLAGCANPGPPRPPSLRLPEMVGDLTAQRIGDRVLLRWITPTRTTDGLDIKGSLTAEICRSTGASPSKTNTAEKKCVTVQTIPAVAGPSSAWDDLPSSLLHGPVTLLTYRIQILNGAGRSAGRSVAAAYAPAGAAPPAVTALNASASEAGGVLRWKRSEDGADLLVDIVRTDLAKVKPTSPSKRRAGGAVAPHRKSGKSAESNEAEASEVHLQARADATGGTADGWAGTVDTTAVMGETYSYVAQQMRVATINGRTLEIRSQPAPAVTLAMIDVFPPRTPSGLATIPGETEDAGGVPSTSYIDLSWEPGSEPDLAGYLIYRQLARPNGDPQGPPGRITPLPIAAPAYRDVAVTPGQRYIYSVTAVDASGNESAPSAKALEIAP